MKTPCSPATGCHRCGNELSGRRTAYCSKECSQAHEENHLWNLARWAAIMRAGGYRNCRCENCGADASTTREVHHIIPLKGPYGNRGCQHHQTNLRVLCKKCHTKVHKDINAYIREVTVK